MSWLDFSESCETDAGFSVDSWSVPSSEAAYLNPMSDGSWHVSFMGEESRPGKSSSTRGQSPRSSLLSALWKMTKRPSPASPPITPRQEDVYAGVNGFVESRSAFGAECDIYLDTDNPVGYYAIQNPEF
jgi:hypothetical protein